jgi:hypothetical protein
LTRENDDVVGRDPTHLNAVGNELNERRGLAGTRRSHDNERFARRALNDGLLRGVEFVAHVCFAWRNEPSTCGHGVNAIGTVRQCLDG